MDYKGRLRRIRQSLDENKLDSLLISHLTNIRYLCGFTGSAGALLITESQCVLLTDGRYKTQAKSEVRNAKIVIARKPPLMAAAEWLKARGSRKKQTIGIEAQHMTVAARSQFATGLPLSMRIKEAAPLVESARMIKDADEIKLIREAVNLGAGLFQTALDTLRPGTKEVEVAAKMEYAARTLGAEGMSFETIIAAGARSALPHGRASASVVPPNGFVVCDFGVILAGYCSDMTRTVFVGRPTSEAHGFYQAVRKAQQAAVAAVEPGVTVSAVDEAARKVLRSNGLGRFFTHSTGHGVGLEIHEAPRIAAGQDEVLRPGMVITIEPGAYVPGKWGVRIEDMVVVTEQGADVLTPTSKELISI